VVPILVPSLAERRDDVLALAEYFAARQAAADGTAAITFAPSTREIMTRYAWPGNIRELTNLIERLTILHAGQTIEPRNLPPEFVSQNAPAAAGIAEQMVATERDILMRALKQADGSKGKAAEILGISRYALKRRLNRLDLD
jgi:DNA-binding NtrC family response regulator